MNTRAFSGNGRHRNNPTSENVPNDGPIPTGTYYIVDRQSGGKLGPMLDWLADRDLWFALYRDDGSIDDSRFVDGVRRGEFPPDLNRDGGCADGEGPYIVFDSSCFLLGPATPSSLVFGALLKA